MPMHVDVSEIVHGAKHSGFFSDAYGLYIRLQGGRMMWIDRRKELQTRLLVSDTDTWDTAIYTSRGFTGFLSLALSRRDVERINNTARMSRVPHMPTVFAHRDWPTLRTGLAMIADRELHPMWWSTELGKLVQMVDRDRDTGDLRIPYALGRPDNNQSLVVTRHYRDRFMDLLYRGRKEPLNHLFSVPFPPEIMAGRRSAVWFPGGMALAPLL